MIGAIIFEISPYQANDKKYVFHNKSIKLTNKGGHILNVPVLNIFLCQKVLYPSIVLFISVMKKPNIDAKLNSLNTYTNDDGYLS